MLRMTPALSRLFFEVSADGELDEFFDFLGQLVEVGQFEILVMAQLIFPGGRLVKQPYPDDRDGFSGGEGAPGVFGQLHPELIADENQCFAGKDGRREKIPQ
jgi:hypothetical protein